MMPIAIRRALFVFGSVLFIALIGVMAVAAARGSFIVLTIAWLGAVALMVGGSVMRLRRSRVIVGAALERAGYEILKMNYRYLRLGPFFSLWNTSRMQDVYRVFVRERSSGFEGTVWARWGRTFFTAPEKLEFRCEDSAIATRLNAEIGRREHFEHSVEHHSTGLAVALTLVLLAPGEIIGHIVAIFYRLAMAHFVDESLLDYSTGGWASVFLLDGVSGIVQGTVTGVIAAYVCARVIQRGDYLIVAYVTAAIVIGFSAFALTIAIINDGLQGIGIQHLGMAANAVGLVPALFVAARGIGARQHVSGFPTRSR
jgi:hypothetical protein